ncbi:MAG: carboxymuconolactone decarboxylase family protein [Pseudomonadales bacterium]|jgi:4-carboxymuconolactone decarboxylase
MSRLERKTYEALTEAQREAFDEVVANRPVKPVDGHIGGPFDVWVRSPEMSRRLVGLGGFFRFRTSVERRYIELAILVTGQFWQAQFEWWAHEPMAREAGVPDDVIAAIRAGDRPELSDPGDAAAYALAREIHNDHKLSEATFAEAKAQFGEAGVAELIGLCGFYGLVSMTLNGFEVGLPAGATPPFMD